MPLLRYIGFGSAACAACTRGAASRLLWQAIISLMTDATFWRHLARTQYVSGNIWDKSYYNRVFSAAFHHFRAVWGATSTHRQNHALRLVVLQGLSFCAMAPKKLPQAKAPAPAAGKRKVTAAALAAAAAPAKKTRPHRTPQTPFEQTDETLYAVDKIINMRFVKGSREYLVRWEGYSTSHDT